MGRAKRWGAILGLGGALGIAYACSSGGGGGGAVLCDQSCSTHGDCPKLSCPCMNLPHNGTTQSCRGGCCVMTCEELCGPIDASADGSGGSAGSAGGGGDSGTAGAAGADAGLVLCPENGSVVLATGQEQVQGVAVDEQGVYWTDNIGNVTRFDKSAQSTVVLDWNLNGANDIVARNGMLYVAFTAKMAALPAAGGTTLIQSVTSLFNTPTSFELDATDIYVGGNQGIGKIPLSMDSIAWFHQGETSLAESVAVDDDYVFFVNYDVWRIPKSGPPKELVAAVGESIDGLAQDAQNLYFIHPIATSNATTGSVVQVPKAGGSPITLAAQVPYASHPVLADGELYFATYGSVSCSSSIQKIVLGGTPAVATVVSGIGYVTALAVDQTSVYFVSTEDQTVRMAPR